MSEKIENPTLVQAMNELKENRTRELHEKFVSELQKSKLYSPVLIEGETEVKVGFSDIDDIVKKQKKRVQFLAIESAEKESYIPAFTSREEVEKGISDSNHFVAVPFDAYVEVVKNSSEELKGIVIDPYGANVILPRQFFVTFKKVADNKADGPIMMAELKERPAELEQALKEILDAEGTIEKAYLQLMKRGETVNLVLVVDNKFPEGVSDEELETLRKNLYDRIGEKTRPAFEKIGLETDHFFIVDYHNEVGAAMTEGREPIYTR